MTRKRRKMEQRIDLVFVSRIPAQIDSQKNRVLTFPLPFVKMVMSAHYYRIMSRQDVSISFYDRGEVNICQQNPGLEITLFDWRITLLMIKYPTSERYLQR